MEELGAGEELSAVRVNFSARLTAAIALIAGRLTPAELAPDWLAGHEGEVRDLASRTRVVHDPALTARTLRGSIEAGGTPALGLADLLRIRRRLGDTGMRGANPAPAVLGALRRDPDLRRAVASSLRRRLSARGDTTIATLDTDALRVTFPSRLRIHLRDGITRTVDGSEPGSCGRPLAEQRAVVEERLAVAPIPA
jgi:hypothetical protein